jgi:predicted acyltransferase
MPAIENSLRTVKISGKTSKKRLASIDVVRGLTLMAMIIVNNPGDWNHIYWPLEHSVWNGFTPTDFVFPNFIFIAGLSIALSMSGKRGNHDLFLSLLGKAMKRGIVLSLLGMGITAIVINFDFSHLRIPGVLQRIGIVSVLVTVLFLKTGNRSLVAVAFSCLIVYYLVLKFVPVPYFGPGNFNPETNLGAWLDRFLFTPNHLFRFTKTWDPEGLLSTLPAIATGIFGALTGVILLGAESVKSKVGKLFGFGLLFVLAGILSHAGFPINKNLWSSSFVLLTAGLSMMLIGTSYWLVDIRGSLWWTPIFMAFGVNSIFAYLCSELLPTFLAKISLGADMTVLSWLYKILYLPTFSMQNNASLAWSITLLLFLSPCLWLLYRRNIILKI